MSMPYPHIKKPSEARQQSRHDALKSLDIIERELAKLRVIAEEYAEGAPMQMVKHHQLRMMEHYTALMASHVLECKPKE